MNGGDAPEEGGAPPLREGEADGRQQESPGQAVEQDVLEAAVARRV